jgi:hypothetical protein
VGTKTITDEELKEYYDQNKEQFLNAENKMDPFIKVKSKIYKKIKKKKQMNYQFYTNKN